MAYEVFKRTGTRVESSTLSIIPEGRIGINAAAARIFAAHGIKAVLLLWDRAGRRLALKATTRGDKNAFAISIANHSGNLRAKSFLNSIGWIAQQRETVPATWNEKARMLEAVLPSEHFQNRNDEDFKTVGRSAKSLKGVR